MIHTLVVTTRVEVSMVRVNPRQAKVSCMWVKHTQTLESQTAFSTSAVFLYLKE